MKELTINGGGLAGLALGIALQERGWAVQLNEASTYPNHRVCGEFIRGVSPETLSVLGIDHLLQPYARHESLTWFMGDHPVYDGQLPTTAIGCSRFTLDEQLARQFESLGGILRTQNRSNKGGEGVIQAGGRVRERDSHWVGLKIHYRNLPMKSDLEMHVSTRAPGGYIGLTPVEDGWTNVSGLFHRTTLQKREGSGSLMLDLLENNGLSNLCTRLEEATPREKSQKGIEGLKFGWQVNDATSNWRIGDSLAIIPPFTGNGMSMALESAELAIPHLEQWASGQASWEMAQQAFQRSARARFRLRLALANNLHPFLYRPSRQKLMRLLLRSPIDLVRPLATLTS